MRRGPRAGLEMWGCSRWPECRGAINIDPEPAGTASVPSVLTGSRPARTYAQVRFERDRARHRLKIRAALPFLTCAALIGMSVLFFAFQPFGIVIASLAAAATGCAFGYAVLRLPLAAIFWAKGIEGERRASAFLEPLLDAGFVILDNRLIPGIHADIDHLVIGPTGVFPIETKNWNGKVEIHGDRLWVGDRDRTWVVEQIYREALAVQVALGEQLTAQRVTVTPILCALGGVPRLGRAIAGVQLTDGRDLARLLRNDRRCLMRSRCSVSPAWRTNDSASSTRGTGHRCGMTECGDRLVYPGPSLTGSNQGSASASSRARQWRGSHSADTARPAGFHGAAGRSGKRLGPSEHES